MEKRVDQTHVVIIGSGFGGLGEPLQVWQQSQAWRLSKRLMEHYLTRQVRRGQPFSDVLDLQRPATYAR